MDHRAAFPGWMSRTPEQSGAQGIRPGLITNPPAPARLRVAARHSGEMSHTRLSCHVPWATVPRSHCRSL